jgi:hypothetical protein
MQDAMISIGSQWWRFSGAQIDTDSWEGEFRSDGKMLLHDDTGAVIEGTEVDEPEDISGVLAIPLPEERRRRQTALTRVLLVAVDMTLAGESLGLETARDLVREVRHCYPELFSEWNGL